MAPKKWLITLFLCMFHIAFARVGFKKDQSLDKITFPPNIVPPRPGIPQGHLRSLGKTLGCGQQAWGRTGEIWRGFFFWLLVKQIQETGAHVHIC